MSIPCACSMGARLVPKKALAYCLVKTGSPACGSTPSQNSASGLPATIAVMTGDFFTQTPPSAQPGAW